MKKGPLQKIFTFKIWQKKFDSFFDKTLTSKTKGEK